MPNIEVHGYGDKSDAMVEKIRGSLRDSSEADEIVTTVFPTVVTTLNGGTSPFLRVISSDVELDDLLSRLKRLDEDIELIMLGQWIPAKQEG